MTVFNSLPDTWQPLVQLWLLRLMVELDGYRYLLDDTRVHEPGLLRAAGITLDEEGPIPKVATVLAALRGRLRELEGQAPTAPGDTTLMRNLGWLTQSLELNEAERAIVLFLTLEHHTNCLGGLLGKFGQLRTHEVHALIATATGLPFERISEALLHTGRLVRSCLVVSDLANEWNFPNKVHFISGIADQMTLENGDPSALFLSNFRKAGASDLTLDHYPHLAPDLEILGPYLRHALDTGRRGVNVLLWGPPGTGKTQLAMALAGHLGSPLYEIAVEDRHTNIHRPEARLGSLQLAQGVLGGSCRPLILFDEVEDVFRPMVGSERAMGEGHQAGQKGFINRILQENRIPTLWITNSIWCLDPAYRRRFDVVLEVPVPPRSVRARMLDQHLGDLPVSPQWKAGAAEHDHLSPAAMERAAKVTRAVLELRPELVAEVLAERLVGNALEALGAPRRARSAATCATPYRLDLLNTDQDLGALCEGLKRTGAGRLCLYGVPGSGKTAFGHHVAQVLDRPLMVKRASDLQSKYVGETEQNLARMFTDATADRAVLLLDEADSFLQDRRGAQHSWEVSQVNEMLTQMEGFEGVFIASTNLMDALDQASLRRFDLKIRFDYLDAAQAQALFRDALATLGLPADPMAEARVGRLGQLTPGDFTAVLRQLRLAPATTPMAFAGLLAREGQLKHGGPRRAIGFHNPLEDAHDSPTTQRPSALGPFPCAP